MCLQRNPKKRPSIPQLLKHAMLKGSNGANAPAPTPAGVGLSVEQLGELWQQVAMNGEAVDASALLQQIQKKGSDGNLDVTTLISASLRPDAPPATPRAAQQQQAPKTPGTSNAPPTRSRMPGTSKRGALPGGSTSSRHRRRLRRRLRRHHHRLRHRRRHRRRRRLPLHHWPPKPPPVQPPHQSRRPSRRRLHRCRVQPLRSTHSTCKRSSSRRLIATRATRPEA